jgi:2-dehydro-3-deoxyphosphogluconate aldolase/(4S)-4-hydroxy-2-oxoglutarate aldolase
LTALDQGGIELVEVTIDTPGALAAVERAAREGMTVGVGTVVTPDQVRAAAAAGAGFVVSPGLVPKVLETAFELGLEAVAGVFTATEIIAATAVGARVMKLFPASCGGPPYLRALRGPFPETRSSRRAASGSIRFRTTWPLARA